MNHLIKACLQERVREEWSVFIFIFIFIIFIVNKMFEGVSAESHRGLPKKKKKKVYVTATSNFNLTYFGS